MTKFIWKGENVVSKIQKMILALTLVLIILASSLVLGLTKQTRHQELATRQAIEESIQESVQAIKEAEQKELAKFDYPSDIYDKELLKKNQLQVLATDQFSSVDQVIEKVLTDYHIDTNAVSIVYQDYVTGEAYRLNADQYRIAASTIKPIYAMLFLDLVDRGVYQLDTEFPYSASYHADGAGSITNGQPQASYSLKDLMAEMIIYSDNTATNMLYSIYNGQVQPILQAVAQRMNLQDLPGDFYVDNYITAEALSQALTAISQETKYEYLLTLMKEEKERQLFTSYVKQGMANKFGRIDQYVHDAGIYYENDQAQYSLVVMTENLIDADQVLAELNLRVNEWHRSQVKSHE